MEQNKDDDRSWHLASKKLSEGLTEAEQSEWQALLRDEKFRHDFELVEKHWHQLATSPYAQIDANEDWQRVLQKIKQTERKSVAFAPWLRYAAVFAFVMMTGYVAWTVWHQRSMPAFVTRIEAPTGARTYVTLPDSSHVWLNAGSSMSFDQRFGTDHRNVTLDGEAYFDVEKGDVPFKVHVSAFDIAVLGTAFNVNAYHDDDEATATLIHGRLKVSRMNAAGVNEEIILNPNEKVTVHGLTEAQSNSTLELEKNIDGAAEADWKDGWLTVRGESLNELSKKIERLYNVTIQFEEDSLKAYKYTGRIQQLSLEQVLKALALTSPIEFVIHEKTVTLRENKNTKSKYQAPAP